jgi:hypothetical protein
MSANEHVTGFLSFHHTVLTRLHETTAVVVQTGELNTNTASVDIINQWMTPVQYHALNGGEAFRIPSATP